MNCYRFLLASTGRSIIVVAILFCLAVISNVFPAQAATWTFSSPGNLLTASNWGDTAPNGVNAIERLRSAAADRALADLNHDKGALAGWDELLDDQLLLNFASEHSQCQNSSTRDTDQQPTVCETP